MNNNNTYHPSNSGAQQRHQRNEQSSRNGSSGAPASVNVKALEARISVLEEEVAQALRLRDASHYYSSAPSSLSEYATAATATAAREGRDMQILQLRIPIKSENAEHAQPGPTLNPASCASGLALLGGDWTSAQSRIALAEGMNDGRGDAHRRNSSLQNEEWDDFDPSQGNQFRGGSNN